MVAAHDRIVPVVSIFFGIVIRMYHDEHPPPHFHASYQGFTAFVGISDGEIVHGSLPKKARGSSGSGRWTITTRLWRGRDAVEGPRDFSNVMFA